MLNPRVGIMAMIAVRLLVETSEVQATTYTWDGDTSSAMSDANNWSSLPPLSGGASDELLFPSVPITSSTSPSVDGAYIYPRISVTGGAYTLVAGGGSLRINSNLQTDGLSHSSASPLIMDADFITSGTGSGTNLGGYVHSNGGGITFNGQVTPGNNVNSSNAWLTVDGTSNVTFNGQFNSGGADAGDNFNVNALFIGGTSIAYTGTVHMGNIGAGYRGRIILGAAVNGVIAVEHANGLGLGGPSGGTGGGTYINSTGSGKVTLSPPSGNISINESFNLQTRGNTNPHLENTAGLNTITTTSINLLGSTTAVIKTTNGSLAIEETLIRPTTASGATLRLDTATGTTITVTGTTTNTGFRNGTSSRVLNIAKDSDGTLENNGQFNNYSGTTAVNAGSYIINGAHTGGATYTVSSGATLGGNGTITTASNAGVTVQGKLSPGSSSLPGALHLDLGTGSLNISSAVAAINSQSMIFELNLPGTSDQVQITNVSSVLNIGSGTLEFDDFAFTTTGSFGPGIYTLFDTGSSISGTLGSTLIGTVGGFSATLEFANGGQDLVLNVVPEPSAFILAFLGLVAAIGVRRKVH